MFNQNHINRQIARIPRETDPEELDRIAGELETHGCWEEAQDARNRARDLERQMAERVAGY
jgi:hypothetical protein